MSVRRIHRVSLPTRAFKYINRKQREVDAGACVATTWANARKTASLKQVEGVLRTMAGERERCTFCADSRGADIDHFLPKIRYKERAFVWENLLLVCAACNRKKGDRFDLDGGGAPLLIDPTAEDPWDYLFFEPRTGCVTAKYDAASGKPNPKGQHTADASILPLNIEAVTTGRQRTHRNILRGVKRFLEQAESNRSISAVQDELLETIRDNDDYGLAEWFFLRGGGDEAVVRQVKSAYPQVWKHIADFLSGRENDTTGRRDPGVLPET